VQEKTTQSLTSTIRRLECVTVARNAIMIIQEPTNGRTLNPLEEVTGTTRARILEEDGQRLAWEATAEEVTSSK
jgi:hypothetical protein